MRIALCRPVRDQIDYAHQRSVDRVAQALHARGDELFDCTVIGVANVDRARAICAGRALAAHTEAMLWTDADVIFDAAETLALFDEAMQRRAVVGALYSTKQRRGVVVGWGLPEELTAYAEGGVHEVRAVGFGLVAMHMGVFLRICEANALPTLKVEGGLLVRPAWMPFAVGDEYPTDDTCFCIRAAKAGVPVLADSRIRVRHAGRYEYQLEDTVGLAGDVPTLKLAVRPGRANGHPPSDRTQA
jgi:hypothetical protein